MQLSVALPSTIPGTPPATVLQWARRAEARGFTSLAVIDRLVYGNYEPLTALTAAAAVTQRVRLITTILISPLRANTAMLAKIIASIDRLSGGRFVLGLGLGGREDDYTAGGLEPSGRGRRLAQQVAEMRRIWGGEKRGRAGAIGPVITRPGGPEIIMGGGSDAALKRTVRLADGWIGGGGGLEQFRDSAAKINTAWTAAGRAGSPRLLSLCYFALGAGARSSGENFVRDYYGPMAERVLAGISLDADAIRTRRAGYETAGCDELVFVPCVGELEQLESLADALSLPKG